MSTLIPNIQWWEIKAMTHEQLRRMRACEVYDGDISKDENYVYTHIPKNPHDSIVSDRVRTKAEFLGVSTNSIYPPEIPETNAIKVFTCDVCGKSFGYKFALSGHKRTHNKVLVEV